MNGPISSKEATHKSRSQTQREKVLTPVVSVYLCVAGLKKYVALRGHKEGPRGAGPPIFRTAKTSALLTIEQSRFASVVLNRILSGTSTPSHA